MPYTLSVGERVLRPPTFHALIVMDELGVSLEFGVTPDNIGAILAGLLSAADGEPWTAEDASATVEAKDSLFVLGVVEDMLVESFPEPKQSGRSGGTPKTWLQASVSYALALSDIGYTHRDILAMTPREAYRLWLALPDPELSSPPSDDLATMPTF